MRRIILTSGLIFLLAGCSGIGQPVSQIGLCDSVMEGLFCVKTKKLENVDSYTEFPSERCNHNGVAYFCDDPAMREPMAIDIETRKNEMKRTLPQDLKN